MLQKKLFSKAYDNISASRAWKKAKKIKPILSQTIHQHLNHQTALIESTKRYVLIMFLFYIYSLSYDLEVV